MNMSKGFIFVLMIFCHIVDDYYLQRILAQMKQCSWWKENAPDALYRYDWAVAMLTHAFSWAFMIMLPFAVQCGFKPPVIYFVLLFGNMSVHFVVDHMKANERIISLMQDQMLHLFQILITWIAIT